MPEATNGAVGAVAGAVARGGSRFRAVFPAGGDRPRLRVIWNCGLSTVTGAASLVIKSAGG